MQKRNSRERQTCFSSFLSQRHERLQNEAFSLPHPIDSKKESKDIFGLLEFHRISRGREEKSLDLISHILSILMQSEAAKRASFRITSNSFSPSSSLIPFLLVFVFKFSFLLFDHLDLLSGIHLSRAAQDQFSLRNTLRDHIINLESRRQT